jgi:hypothetical protein
MSLSPWLPTPPEIAKDPELAPLAMLEAALDVTAWALHAQHPELADDAALPEPITKLAAQLLAEASRLRSLIGTYRVAVALRRDLSNTPF